MNINGAINFAIFFLGNVTKHEFSPLDKVGLLLLLLSAAAAGDDLGLLIFG